MPQGDAFLFVSIEHSTLTWTGRLSLQQAKEEPGPGRSSPGEDPVILQKGALGTWSCYFPGPCAGFSHLATRNAESYSPGTRVEHPGFHEPEVKCSILESVFFYTTLDSNESFS